MNAMANMISMKIQAPKAAESTPSCKSPEKEDVNDQSFSGILKNASKKTASAQKSSSVTEKAKSATGMDQPLNEAKESNKSNSFPIDNQALGSDASLNIAPIGFSLPTVPQNSTSDTDGSNNAIQAAAMSKTIGSTASEFAVLSSVAGQDKSSIIGKQNMMENSASDGLIMNQKKPLNESNDNRSTLKTSDGQDNVAVDNKLAAMEQAQSSNVSGSDNFQMPFPLNIVTQQSSALPKKDMQVQQSELILPSPSGVSGENKDVQAIVTGESEKTLVEQKPSGVDQGRGQFSRDNSLSYSLSVSSSASINLPSSDNLKNDLNNNVSNPISAVVAKNISNSTDTVAYDENQFGDQKEQLQKQQADSVSDANSLSTNTFQGVLEQHGISDKTLAIPTSPNQAGQNSAHDPYNISSQIVQQAHLLKNDHNSEMIIQLKPEHLGELTLKVAVENGVVSTTFHSGNPEVRSVLESSLPQLKQELSNQGIKVDYVGVSAQLGQSLSDGSQQNLQQQWKAKTQSKRQSPGEDFIQAVEATSNTPSIATASGVDYRI